MAGGLAELLFDMEIALEADRLDEQDDRWRNGR